MKKAKKTVTFQAARKKRKRSIRFFFLDGGFWNKNEADSVIYAIPNDARYPRNKEMLTRLRWGDTRTCILLSISRIARTH
jgi:hypothetical protein